MICITKAFEPVRKTNNPFEWKSYIEDKLRESRGLLKKSKANNK